MFVLTRRGVSPFVLRLVRLRLLACLVELQSYPVGVPRRSRVLRVVALAPMPLCALSLR